MIAVVRGVHATGAKVMPGSRHTGLLLLSHVAAYHWHTTASSPQEPPMRVLLPICALAAVATSHLSAQQIFRSPGATDGVGVSAAHVLSRANLIGGSFPSAVVTVDGYFTLGRKTAIEVSIPFSYYKWSGAYDVGAPTGNQTGNPYIGLDQSLSSHVQLKLGARPGLFAIDGYGSAAAAGIYADFDHLEEWAGKNTAVRGSVEFGGVPRTGAFATGMLGVTFLFNDADNVYADYGFRLGYQFTGVTASFQLTGRLRMEDGLDSFSEKDFNQVAFVIGGSRGTIRPFFSARTFLDDDIHADGLQTILSLGLTISAH
jgi:hypothetical protein